MFTGIIETVGEIISLKKENSNLHIMVAAGFANELKIDQSVSHNGVCLTVLSVNANHKSFSATAIDETLKRSNLGNLRVGDKINLERALRADARLDGHFVQGHVDAIAVCTRIENKNGSHIYTFENDGSYKNLVVEKGSVCVNGVSLTVVNAASHLFSVAIIPYTYENTAFKFLQKGDVANVEFDVLGKYVVRYMQGVF